jgi:hypothetical protein
VCLSDLQYYKCVCPPGFTGENCQHEIDECDPNPCHRGRCTDLLDGYECDCSGTGFEGPACSVNINECLASPCIQGNCTDLPGSYQCDCLPGYCGTNCQREDPCQLVSVLRIRIQNRIAGFFLVQHTKTGNTYQIAIKYTEFWEKGVT